MGQYIDKDKIRYRKVPIDTTQELVYRSDIEAMDGEDVAPVRHGHWNTYPESKDFQCSICEIGVDLPTLYCPNCGAKMDEEAEQ